LSLKIDPLVSRACGITLLGLILHELLQLQIILSQHDAIAVEAFDGKTDGIRVDLSTEV
jgi:hypothetical protein